MNELISTFQEATITVGQIEEIRESERTEEQKKLLEEAKQFIFDNTLELIETLVKPVFQRVMFAEDPIPRWESVVQDPNCKPPFVRQNETINGHYLDELFRKIHNGQMTVAGVYEEASAMAAQYESELKKAASKLRAILGWDKLDKMNSIFATLEPPEVTQRVEAAKNYAELFKRRWNAFSQASDNMVQLKHINIGTPDIPHRIMEPTVPDNRPRPSNVPSTTFPSRRSMKDSENQG